MNMDYKGFPVACMSDFEAVVVDVINYEDEYIAQLNFFKQFADDGGQRGEGLVLATQICGETLLEIYQKIALMIEVGFFDGTNVAGHGTLYDEEHNEIESICWHQFGEDDYDEDTDITDEIIHPQSKTLH
jgi:hypothetical protein